MAPTILSLITILVALSSTIFASPLHRREDENKCERLTKRKEWRRMTNAEKHAYTTAVLCLSKKPSKGIYPDAPGVFTRYDDFVATHITMTPSIHFNGQFLPWHRAMVWTFESVLRDECGYGGAQPYWDWSLDRGLADLSESPVFDAEYGFGGNGAFVPLTDDDDDDDDEDDDDDDEEEEDDGRFARLSKLAPANLFPDARSEEEVERLRVLFRGNFVTNPKTSPMLARTVEAFGKRQECSEDRRETCITTTITNQPGFDSGDRKPPSKDGSKGKPKPPKDDSADDDEEGEDVPKEEEEPEDAHDMPDMPNMPHPGHDPDDKDTPSLPLFDPSSMHTGGGSITTGPFKDLELHLGPGGDGGSSSSCPSSSSSDETSKFKLNTHCLTRNFAPRSLSSASDANIDAVLKAKDFAGVGQAIERLHVVGHGAVGGLMGEMGNFFSSVNGM
ncbi:hypothetical protein LTS18_005107, partial [Coniosporium uncinatum]